RRADKELLTRPGTKRDGLPTVLRGHRDANARPAFGVAYRPDYAGNHRSDLGILGQKPREQLADAVDNTVLNLELVVRGPQPHALVYRADSLSKLLQAGMRADFVEALEDFMPGELPIAQQRLVERGQIRFTVAAEGFGPENTEPVVDMLHARVRLMFVVCQDAAPGEFHIARVPSAFVMEHRHERGFSARFKRLLHAGVRTRKVRIAV